MKVRMGFVSNSSSESFLLYGASVLEEATHDLASEIREAGLYVQYKNPDYDDNEVYVGRSWDSVRDDETGGEFKASIAKAIGELFGDDITCGTHEDSWYNG